MMERIRRSATSPTSSSSPRRSSSTQPDAVGSTVIDIAGTQVDLAEPWPRQRMSDAVSDAVANVHPTTPVETVRAIAETHGVRWEPQPAS